MIEHDEQCVLVNEISFELQMEAISMLIFAVMPCHSSSGERKTWKIQAWTDPVQAWIPQVPPSPPLKQHNIIAKIIYTEKMSNLLPFAFFEKKKSCCSSKDLEEQLHVLKMWTNRFDCQAQFWCNLKGYDSITQIWLFSAQNVEVMTLKGVT